MNIEDPRRNKPQSFHYFFGLGDLLLFLLAIFMFGFVTGIAVTRLLSM